MATSQTATPNDRRMTWPLDIVIGGLGGLLLVPVVLAIQALPWAQTLPRWYIPLALGGGILIGVVALVPRLPVRWWWPPLVVVPLLAGAGGLGAVFASHSGTPGSSPALVTDLLGGYLALLGATLPWLVFRGKQMWLAIGLVWLTLVASLNGVLTPVRIWQVVWMMALSLTILGLFHLRGEVRLWRARYLEQIGPVLWPSARAIVTLSLVVALLGLTPLSLVPLNRWWTQLFHNGVLNYDAPNGTPVVLLSSRLPLNAPDVTNQQIILTYRVTSGTKFIPPLLGTTLDTYAAGVWSQGQSRDVPLQTVSTPPVTANNTLRAAITIQALPSASNGIPLLGFDQPVAFSVPAQAQVIGTDQPGVLSVAAWQAGGTVGPGTTYTETAVVIPDDAVGAGSLPDAITQRMLATPASLQAELRATALALAGHATTPAQRARAIIDAMYTHGFTLDAKAVPPANVDPIQWFLQAKRGNVLLWTTAYILMGRAIGLPLRLAEGYLPGKYDAQRQSYVVRATDATVWAQLAIPGMGWLDLFPASTVQQITVPGTIIYDTTPAPPQATPVAHPTPQPVNVHPAPNAVNAGSAAGWLVLIGIFLLLLLTAGALALALQWARFGRQLTPLARLFARIALLAQLAGIRLQRSDTASQATAKVAAYVPEQREALATLNRTYERFVYGPPDRRGGLPLVGEAWQRLSQRLWQLVINRPWRRKHDIAQHDTATKG